jgi:EmrB/QacA subfamily drug resistance transporter
MTRAINDPQHAFSRRWLTLLVLCISLTVIGLDNTVLNVAIPTLARDLHASTSQLQWIVDAYTIVFAGLLLTAGSLGDRFGRYKTLALGLAIFGTGSALSAFTGSATMLIVTRAFMGIGGALIMPSTLSILTNVFTNPTERGKAIGIWAGVSALGIGLGPVTGGFLLSHFWWGSVFLVNVPIVAVGLIGGWFLVPDSRDPAAPKLDPVGALLSIAGLSTLLYGIIEAPVHGWGAPSTEAAFAIGVVVIGLFLLWEMRSSHPMLDLRFFRNPRFTAASGAITFTFFTMFGTLFLLTQYLQSVLGYSALKAGALLLPQAFVMLVVAPSSSGFVRRFGNKVVVTFGLTVVALTLLLFSRLGVDAPAWQIIAVTCLLGTGMGNVMAPATDSIMGSLPRERAGVGSAVNDTTRQTGGAIGVAVFGSVLASRYAGHVLSGARADHLPADVTAVVKTNVGQAAAFARSHASGPFSRTALAIARQSYVSALHTSVLVGAALMLLSALAVFLWLPARAANEDVVPERSATGRVAAVAMADGNDALALEAS